MFGCLLVYLTLIVVLPNTLRNDPAMIFFSLVMDKAQSCAHLAVAAVVAKFRLLTWLHSIWIVAKTGCFLGQNTAHAVLCL